MRLTYTVKQVAEMFGCSVGSVYRMMREGELKYLRIGKSGKSPTIASVNEYIERNTVIENPPLPKERKAGGNWLQQIANL